MALLPTNIATGNSSHIAYTNQVNKKTNAWFDVKADYGAVGDGVADDTAEIQAAIDAVVAAGGGVVFFPQGLYLISATLLVANFTGIRLVGAGQEATRLKSSAAVAGLPMIEFRNCTSPEVSQMTILGNSAAPPSAGIEASAKAPVIITPTRLTVRSTVLGDTSSGGLINGIHWNATADQNNDLAHIQEVQCRNLTTAFKIGHSNSLEHQFFDCVAGPNVQTGILCDGGSFMWNGGTMNVTEWYFDLNAGPTYHHDFLVSNLTSEGNGKWLRVASGANDVDFYFSSCELNGGPQTVDMIQHAGGNSRLVLSACQAVTGQPGTVIRMSSSTSRLVVQGCRLGVQEIAYNGGVLLAGVTHEVGTLTLTNLGSGILTSIAQSGGGKNWGDMVLGGAAVSYGANDSGGAGFKVLRVPN